ncbi:hypothetical protein LLEC1_04769 [Akanthomyces lecanii]|uniref:Peptidase M43 pregnancy-associated plasma-A domain-containing protein n=1 Tax=Cordyceps confragosa TaxID=2714763 RepID=A0A179I2B6_CORDF|nr:hypothetical protein LLEC1_04769 [Akanthomyces lecanii]
MFYPLQLSTALLALGSLAGTISSTTEHDSFCGSQPSADILAIHKQLELGEPGQHFPRRDAGELISLDTWVHVVAANETKQGGWLNSSDIAGQMSILNKAFAPSNITFMLAGTTRTVNASWATRPNGYEKDLKTKLHRGTSRTLNLYYMPGLDSGGVCVFPNMNAYEGDALALDGCMVGTFSLPGNAPPFNMGMTTVHEVGHWFGLLHTFEGGCDDVRGDFIADTPAERSPNEGKCPHGRDTCPELPGLDPIENYMDYSAETIQDGFDFVSDADWPGFSSCYSRFTPLQIVRMRTILSLIRLGLQ